MAGLPMAKRARRSWQSQLMRRTATGHDLASENGTLNSWHASSFGCIEMFYGKKRSLVNLVLRMPTLATETECFEFLISCEEFVAAREAEIVAFKVADKILDQISGCSEQNGGCNCGVMD